MTKPTKDKNLKLLLTTLVKTRKLTQSGVANDKTIAPDDIFENSVRMLESVFGADDTIDHLDASDPVMNEPGFSDDVPDDGAVDETQPATAPVCGIHAELIGTKPNRQRVILTDSRDPGIVIGHYKKDDNKYIFIPKTEKPLTQLYCENALQYFTTAIQISDKLLCNDYLKKAEFAHDAASTTTNTELYRLLLFTNRDKERRFSKERSLRTPAVPAFL